PIQGPGLVGSFVCNCSDCRKITASMFASNFIVADTHLTHLRGRDNLNTYSQSRTIAAGNIMTNYFCSTCGTLMYRIGSGYPGISVLRIGTVDDFNLHETKLKPQVEQFVENRVGWLHGLEGSSRLREWPGLMGRYKQLLNSKLLGSGVI
ncbi:Mss4-like protein, partial [Mycena leptocephala]